MQKYNMQNGLVSVIADDINGIQDAVNGNITKRLKMVLENCGLKASVDDKFELDYSYEGGDIFQITCSGLGLVVFGDYVIVPEQDSYISTTTSIIWKGYVYLSKILSYSNDQTYKPGHPVDIDGNLLPSGYHAESEDVLSLSFITNDVVELKDSILLAKVERSGNTLTFEDLRMENSLSLKDIGLYEACDDELSDFTVDSIYQTQLLNQDVIEDADTNVLSSRNNLSIARVYAMFTWTETDNAFAYEIRFQVYDSEGQKIGYPRTEILASGLAGDTITTFFEVTEGVLYHASIRILSNSPNHAPGPWITKQFVGGAYSSLKEDNPIPTPTITIKAIQGVEETYTPLLIEITIDTADDTPQPARVQIFQTSEFVADAGVNGHLIYEGPAVPFRYLVPAGGVKYFLGRVVGPGGICSSVVYSSEGFTASNTFPEYVPQDVCLNIPLAAAAIETTNMPVQAFSFYPPREGARLKYIYFQGEGSVLRSSNSEGNFCAEIVIGTDDTVFVAPSSSRGRYAYECQTKAAFGSSDNSAYEPHRQITTLAPGDIIPPDSGEEYTRLRLMESFVDVPIWAYDKKLTVWVTAYDWASGSTFQMSVSGNLILVFESTPSGSELPI